MSMQVVAGIDGGSTKTRVQIRCASRMTVVAEATLEGSTNLYQYGEEGPETIGSLLDRVLEMCLTTDHRLVAAVLGTAGIDAHGDDARHLAACNRSRHLAPLGAMLRVCSDVEPIDAMGELDHRVCIIAGTGSNTLAIARENGRIVSRHQVGGLDLALSDDGSGAWIGHHAMRAALRDLQGIEASSLGPDILRHFGLPVGGPEPWRALRTTRLALSKAQLAALTKAVVVPSAQGDKIAHALLQQAGRALAESIVAAARAIAARDALEILAVGSVWKASAVLEATRSALAQHYPQATFRLVDPAEGAARMARHLFIRANP